MSLPQTEILPDHGAFDALPAEQAAASMLDGQRGAVDAVRGAIPQIIEAVEIISDTLKAGGTLVYAAAGSSGLMALADGCELPGTFGISPDQIRIHMAGGVPSDGRMPGDTEDDAGAGEAVASGATPRDTFIVLSASGTTPYALAVAKAARNAGARIIAIANNPGTPLLALGDVAVCLVTPPEIIAGSTRLNAGTAQKAALNLMSSLTGVRLGHVYQGRMVNLVADNAKLTRRACGIVEHVSGVSGTVAEDALRRADGRVKLAILLAGGCEKPAAETLLKAHDGHLGPALAAVRSYRDTQFQKKGRYQ